MTLLKYDSASSNYATPTIELRAPYSALLLSWLHVLADMFMQATAQMVAWHQPPSSVIDACPTTTTVSMASSTYTHAFAPVLNLVNRLETLIDHSTTNASVDFREAAQVLVSSVKRTFQPSETERAAHQLIVGLNALLKQWMDETDELREWYMIGDALGVSTAVLPKRFVAPRLLVAQPNEWDALADQLRRQAEPDEDLVDQLVGEGMVLAPEQAQAAVCRLLATDNAALCYELCHALLDFEIVIDASLAEAMRPLLDHTSRRIFMAALHVVLKQEAHIGARQWEAMRDRFSEERRLLGDDLMGHVLAGRG